MGYKESPVAEARHRFAAIVRVLSRDVLAARADTLEAAAGGPLDLVLPVPSSLRPGGPPLARVPGLGADVEAALPGATWAPHLLRPFADRTVGGGGAGRPRVGHMRPDAGAFVLDGDHHGEIAGRRAILLDDLYVSGARAQSAAAALRRAGARATVVVPLGRLLRPDRVPSHARFLRRHTRGDGDPCAEG
jgi:hypothetical protein